MNVTQESASTSEPSPLPFPQVDGETGCDLDGLQKVEFQHKINYQMSLKESCVPKIEWKNVSIEGKRGIRMG